ncbi:uncharacterized protein LOC132257663 [Phlebotomus argentipes]|uniref:uncharacterized protein LOC132257663 n=1 Tax=Phlebotomus argentipes TaxID=94469 RepID=UPI002892E2EE|nr:uncharacterized protein LOC132257663 [Phlebotomus argentipes]
MTSRGVKRTQSVIMAVSREKLRTEINAILKDADLSVMSAKKVRQTLEEKLNCNLSARKKEVDELVMDFVNSKDNNDASGSEEEDESEEEAPKRGAKRPPPTKKPVAKKRGGDSSDESESGGEEASDDDYKPQKNSAKKGAPKGKRKKDDSESDSDEDWKAPKKAPKKAGAAAASTGKGKGRGTGFTRAYTLSPELAALMGAEALPRHEVVKKMWAMIKERNLYDPKNKQYAICDNDLIKVIGVKRFRTFGMLKYLREHFLD